ncbi:DNA repair protein RecO [Alkalicoccus saliphilus]|uniref:DNA repair protein RecO n=1 Tax=Alkalicoccus saliphilus TaxID=200989 RepID=A0A2T4UAW5_9BACI|nr:DNA repair protein RecO [Alkalicoccus saliphilus]PTL40542.1 DNA repair protein RecO [Alkalicoccus saliphilus]
MLQKVEGIVLRTTDYGENHKIITIYSRENGKTALMARGAKKTKSKFASASQLFVHGVFIYHQSRGMGSLNQADIVDSFRYIRSDLMKTAYASYAVELLDKLTEDKQPAAPLFDLLLQIFSRMNEEDDPEILIRIFETKMLYVSGAAPVLNACVNCGNMDEITRFSLKYAGVLCRHCAHIDDRPSPAGPHAVKLLRLFQQINPSRIGKISVKSSTKKELKDTLEAYYEEYVGVYIKAKRFLKQMEDLEAGNLDSGKDFS